MTILQEFREAIYGLFIAFASYVASTWNWDVFLTRVGIASGIIYSLSATYFAYKRHRAEQPK